MTVDFNDYFWGEKNNGFDVLYHNMKFGLVASKELSEFLREKSNIEEQNSRLMSKLAHKASTGTLNSTFAPVWTILRTSAEKLSTLHLQMVQKLTELVKDVAKYADELHKKHKSVKEEESQTLECVQSMQTSTAAVQKSRDLYTNKVLELEKLRKENGSQKDIDKIETKLRKLQDEYKSLLDKHNPIKNEFERRMTQSCRRFQEIEEIHLRQMKEFLSTYLELLQNNHDMVGQVHSDFKRQFLDMTVDKLLEQFVLNKYTGLEKPEVPELDFIPLSIQHQQSSSSSSATRLNQSTAASMAATAAAGAATATATTASISSATNSNSATSIQGGATSRINAVEGLSLGSTGGGSGSLLNADDTIFGNVLISSSPRPTSPELINTTVATTMISTSITTTTTTSTSTVKSNFRNWFTSNIPSSNKQQQSNTSASSAGNIGMDSNGSTTTTTTTGTNITNIKNSLNSELQSQPDNNNKDQRQQHEQRHLKQQQGTSSKKFIEHTRTTSLNHHHHHHHQHHQQEKQQQQQQQQQQQEQQSPSNAMGNSQQRRTTSLLNIFSSNSQVSGILRSRRDKAKTKKSKKKKDGENADNIREERLTSIDRTNNTHDYDDNGKLKTQNSSGSSGGIAGASFASGSGDSTLTGAGGGAIGGAGGIGGGAATSAGAAGMLSTNAGASANGGTGVVGTGSTTAGGVGTGGTTTGGTGIGAYGANEVDEDGYSMQPPKEIAWDENRDNAGSFYSDSDSDSDNDKPERRIHVKIKPLNNGQAPMSASVDELRATVENISLSPTGVFSLGSHTQHSQQLQLQSRIASRQQSPEISNASTPTASVHPYAPLQSPTLSMSNNSKYADLGDIFSELGDMSASAPASATLTKTTNHRQIPTPTSSSIAIPRPPSRRSEMVTPGLGSGSIIGRGRMSPSPMNRADSIGSLEFRTAAAGGGGGGSTGGAIGSSRGPSPLSIGISDTIPVALAFHEIIHAYFRGSDESRCQVKISGEMLISFPAGIVNILANNPNPAKLCIRIKNIQNIENFIPNGKIVQIDKNQTSSFSTIMEFNMPALTAVLKHQAEQNPTVPYFNVDILKYQVRSKTGASSCPFQLVSYWKCEPTFTALKIDYKYNNHAMASSSPLLNVQLSVPVNGSVRNVQSKPHSVWMGESNRLCWNFTDISQNSQDGGVGTLRARLELNDGPSTPALVTTTFNCEGTTLSGIDFELQGGGYRLSLVKRRFAAGKYVCEGDGIRSGATPTPPSVGSSSPYSAKSN